MYARPLRHQRIPALVEYQIDAHALARQLSREGIIEKIMLALAAIERLIRSEEIADLVLCLCSESGAVITGGEPDGGFGLDGALISLVDAAPLHGYDKAMTSSLLRISRFMRPYRWTLFFGFLDNAPAGRYGIKRATPPAIYDR